MYEPLSWHVFCLSTVAQVWLIGDSLFGISLGLTLGLVTPHAPLGLEAFVMDAPTIIEAEDGKEEDEGGYPIGAGAV